MARVTVEDCIDKIPNRYELLMVAAQRAKDISAGSPITLPRDNDKNPVVALREIAENTVNIEDLQKSLVMGLQKYVEVEEPEEEELEIMAAEKELVDLDEQFSGLLVDSDVNNMQVVDEDGEVDSDVDLDLASDSDDDLLDDEGFDDSFDMDSEDEDYNDN